MDNVFLLNRGNKLSHSKYGPCSGQVYLATAYPLIANRLSASFADKCSGQPKQDTFT